MLKTETNTAAMEKRVRAAANAVLGRKRFQVDFEHGQWWVTELGTGAQWSACDSGPGPDSHGGFCFEQVTQGDSE